MFVIGTLHDKDAASVALLSSKQWAPATMRLFLCKPRVRLSQASFPGLIAQFMSEGGRNQMRYIERLKELRAALLMTIPALDSHYTLDQCSKQAEQLALEIRGYRDMMGPGDFVIGLPEVMNRFGYSTHVTRQAFRLLEKTGIARQTRHRLYWHFPLTGAE